MADEKLSQQTETTASTGGFFHVIRDIGSGLQSFKISIANLLKTTAAIIFGGQAAGASNIEAFSATASFDLNNGNSQKMTLTANITSLAVTNKQNGGSYLIYLVQDGTGGWTIAAPGASFGNETDNSAASFVTAADAVNIINVNVDPGGVTYWTLETRTP